MRLKKKTAIFVLMCMSVSMPLIILARSKKDALFVNKASFSCQEVREGKKGILDYFYFIFTGYSSYQELQEQNEMLKNLLAKILPVLQSVCEKNKEKKELQTKIAAHIDSLVTNSNQSLKDDVISLDFDCIR